MYVSKNILLASLGTLPYYIPMVQDLFQTVWLGLYLMKCIFFNKALCMYLNLDPSNFEVLNYLFYFEKESGITNW